MPDTVIKSVGRTFDILDYYREVKRPLSVRDIAERFGYPLISASALLKSLATLGYLTYDRYSHLYFPSMKLPLLAEWVYESTYKGREVLALAEKLSEQTGETIIVASQSDIYMNFVILIPSRYELQVNPVGIVRRPLCLSGTGISLLSVQSDDAIKRVYQRSVRRLSKSEFRPNLTLDRVMGYVNETRRKGYFFTHELTTTGAGLVAMPFPDRQAGSNMAVSVSGVLDRMQTNFASIVREMRKLLKQYAKRGSR
jgi:DNA-binding IclR family transcriptional regulator